MGSAISANVSEAVEKIATDMKKIITYAPYHEVYSLHSHGIQP